VLAAPGAEGSELRGGSRCRGRREERKCELLGDRLSDHRCLANCFGLFLHALAANLLVRLRRLVADPPPPGRVFRYEGGLRWTACGQLPHTEAKNQGIAAMGRAAV
jgi:hypothetical protein